MNRLLFDLQEADNHIARLGRERGKLDDGTELRGERDILQKAVAEEQSRLKELNANRSDKELQLKTTEEKIKRQQDRLMNAKSAHEVTSLQRDIAALSNARGDLDEAVLTLMDDIETASTRLTDLEAQLQEKSQQTAEVERQFAAETERLNEEIEAANAQRQSIVAQLDPVSLEKYNTSAKRHHGVALVHNEKGTCSGCGTALTPFNLREAKSQEWPTCENCNRLLYIE